MGKAYFWLAPQFADFPSSFLSNWSAFDVFLLFEIFIINMAKAVVIKNDAREKEKRINIFLLLLSSGCPRNYRGDARRMPLRECGTAQVCDATQVWHATLYRPESFWILYLQIFR
jgi:hypothetical protein